jgi:hypothetical protein
MAQSKRFVLLAALAACTTGVFACNTATTEEEAEGGEDAFSSGGREGAYPFERSVTCVHHRREQTRVKGRELTRAWHLKSHGCLKGKLTVDAALPADKRVGVFASQAPRDVWMRITNINQPADDVVDLRGLAIKVLRVEGAKKMPDKFDGQDFLMNDTKVHFVNSPDEVMRASEITDGSPKNLLKDGVLLFHMATGGKKQLTMPHTLLAHEYHSRAPFKFGSKYIIRYFVKTCAPTADEGRIAANTPSKDRLTVDFHTRAKADGVCLDFMAQFRSAENSKAWLDDLVTPWNDTAVKLARIEFAPQDPKDNEGTCKDLSYDPLHTIAAHEGVGVMNKGREWIYRASREASGKRRQIERYACEKIFPDFETRRESTAEAAGDEPEGPSE